MNEFRNHDQPPHTSLQLKEQFFHPQQNEAANIQQLLQLKGSGKDLSNFQEIVCDEDISSRIWKDCEGVRSQ